MTNAQRYLAFASILVVYFFYCYNFMVSTFVKPTMIYTIADGGFSFTLKQTESIFAIMSFATIPGTLAFGWFSSKIGKKHVLQQGLHLGGGVWNSSTTGNRDVFKKIILMKWKMGYTFYQENLKMFPIFPLYFS